MKYTTRFIVFVLIVSAGASVHARTDDGKSLAAMAREARARVKDFKKEMDEREREDNSRELDGQKWRAEKDREIAKREAAREQFVRERNAKPAEDLIRLNGEANDEKRKAREEAERNRLRKIFVDEQREREALIEREGQIDEKREYGL